MPIYVYKIDEIFCKFFLNTYMPIYVYKIDEIFCKIFLNTYMHIYEYIKLINFFAKIF